MDEAQELPGLHLKPQQENPSRKGDLSLRTRTRNLPLASGRVLRFQPDVNEPSLTKSQQPTLRVTLALKEICHFLRQKSFGLELDHITYLPLSTPVPHYPSILQIEILRWFFFFFNQDSKSFSLVLIPCLKLGTGFYGHLDLQCPLFIPTLIFLNLMSGPQTMFSFWWCKGNRYWQKRYLQTSAELRRGWAAQYLASHSPYFSSWSTE